MLAIRADPFVARHSKKFHDHVTCRHEKTQKIDGLEGMFSLKRLPDTCL